MTVERHINPGDPWPAGISDGLASECEDCGEMPVLDYTVDDTFWALHGVGPAVLCLGCLHRRCRGIGLPQAIRSIQVVGAGATAVLRVDVLYRYRRGGR